jgi:hypothetical protein
MTIPRGHSAAYVRDMFCEALEYGAAHGAWWEWFASENADQFLWRERDGGRWSKLDARARAAWVADQLVNSTELMPEHMLSLLNLESGQTYADVARRLRTQLAEGEASEDGTTGDSASSLAILRVEIPRELMDRLAAMSGQLSLSLDDAVRHAITEWLS